MKLAITKIERSVEVTPAYADEGYGCTAFNYTTEYEIGYIVILEGNKLNTIEDYINIETIEDITFERAEEIVRRILTKNIDSQT